MTSRRAFLIAGGSLLAGGVGVLGYTFGVEPFWVETVRRSMPLVNLPDSLAGRTLLQLSDLHVGRVDSGYLIETMQEARQLQPDFVAFTGDFVTYRSAAELDELARVLSHAPRGRLGTVAVLGNHDFGYSWRQRDVADRVTQVVRGSGATVLRNEVTSVAGLDFVGMGDYWTPDFDDTRDLRELLELPPRRQGDPVLESPRRILAALDATRPTVVLCHNPDFVDEPIWDGVRGWVLAGHTHGGQCKAPFLPPPVLPIRNRRYAAGSFDLAPGRTLYVNRGIGHLIPVRFNVRPEMTLFTLASA